MPANDIPQAPAAPVSGSGKGLWQSAVDGLVTICMSLPVALRALIAFSALGLIGLLVYQKYVKPPADNGAARSILSVSSNSQYTGGTADPSHAGADNSNPQNVEANHKSAEDDAAYKWHFDHQEDSPPEVALGDAGNPNEYLHYKYFAKSDKCLYVRRKEGNNEYSQWLSDPLYSSHDIDRGPSRTAHTTQILRPEQASLMARLWDALLPQVFAAPPQAANCQNPHPGTFQYWWGTPLDSCRSPMYRQFQDGCTHYQVYNRCASSWENQINWTVCKPGPHH